MRSALGLAFAAFALIACAAGAAGTSQGETSLTVVYWANGADTATPERWTLRCNPPRGTLPRPAVACRRLAADGRKLIAHVGGGQACTQIWGGPQTARVIGRVLGERVWASFSRADGCQISRWQRVSPWLLPPGGVTG
jgi:Subtilisin inhibitor-like